MINMKRGIRNSDGPKAEDKKSEGPHIPVPKGPIEIEDIKFEKPISGI